MEDAWQKSFKQYEALESAAEDGIRYEFIDRQVYSMSGGTVAHHLIIQNALLSLVGYFRPKGCRVTSETVKLEVLSDRRYVYPDLMVTCSERDKQANRIMRDPVILMEVLSQSTENKDLGKKVALYQRIPTLQSYIIVDRMNVGYVCMNGIQAETGCHIAYWIT